MLKYQFQFNLKKYLIIFSSSGLLSLQLAKQLKVTLLLSSILSTVYRFTCGHMSKLIKIAHVAAVAESTKRLKGMTEEKTRDIPSKSHKKCISLHSNEGISEQKRS